MNYSSTKQMRSERLPHARLGFCQGNQVSCFTAVCASAGVQLAPRYWVIEYPVHDLTFTASAPLRCYTLAKAIKVALGASDSRINDQHHSTMTSLSPQNYRFSSLQSLIIGAILTGHASPVDAICI